MSRSVGTFLRNSSSLAVSLFVLVVALLGSALAERAPLEQHRQRAPHGKVSRPPPVRHDTQFKAVPNSKLQVRAVQYDGATNGTLTVQVKNPDKVPLTFNAAGLYFVPEGDPDQAPQRLGAVGPMQIASGPEDEKLELAIAPGATVEVNLDVFCIDSHRPSPSPQNRFHIGATKLPRELTRTIEQRADKAVEEAKASGAAKPRPAAKGKIQSDVWQSRDANWVELDGEGKQEVGKRKR